MAAFGEEWDDVEPIPQDDGPNPVVKIAYSKEFVEGMDLFRAVVFKNELSERVLGLTQQLLDLNPANYTIWQYRRKCLTHLKSNLHAELDFMDSFAQENPKNYQIWYHRRAVVTELGDPSRELAFCALVFEEDGKNYHAWAHRQWAISTYGLWEGELAFVESLLEIDIRNNSAWNQRWFCVHGRDTPLADEQLATEVQFALVALEKVKNNESAWSYLRGLAKRHPQLLPRIYDACNAMVTSIEAENALAMGLLVDLCELQATTDALAYAQQLCQRLQQVDRIRTKSWARRIERLELRKIAVCV